MDTWSSFTIMEMMMMKLRSDGLIRLLRGTGDQMRKDLTDNEAIGEIAERMQRQGQCRCRSMETGWRVRLAGSVWVARSLYVCFTRAVTAMDTNTHTHIYEALRDYNVPQVGHQQSVRSSNRVDPIYCPLDELLIRTPAHLHCPSRWRWKTRRGPDTHTHRHSLTHSLIHSLTRSVTCFCTHSMVGVTPA